MLSLLAARAPLTACPSEVARAAWTPAQGPRDAWRGWMEATRAAAARLAKRGLVLITQRGVEVPPARVERGEARGPLRVALVRGGGEGGRRSVDT